MRLASSQFRNLQRFYNWESTHCRSYLAYVYPTCSHLFHAQHRNLLKKRLRSHQQSAEECNRVFGGLSLRTVACTQTDGKADHIKPPRTIDLYLPAASRKKQSRSSSRPSMARQPPAKPCHSRGPAFRASTTRQQLAARNRWKPGARCQLLARKRWKPGTSPVGPSTTGPWCTRIPAVVTRPWTGLGTARAEERLLAEITELRKENTCLRKQLATRSHRR